MKVEEVSLNEIVVHSRQRSDFPNMLELMRDIYVNGLINPITVRKEGARYRLIAGGRRLEAYRRLEWSKIPAHVIEADDLKHMIVEFAENYQREDLPWQEKVAAFDDIRRSLDPETNRDMAKTLAMPARTVSRYILVGKNLDQVKQMETITAAESFLLRKQERQKGNEQEIIKARTRAAVSGTKVFGVPLEKRAAPEPTSTKVEVVQADFTEWARTYDGLPFSLIHCDFPYGIKLDKGGVMTTAGEQNERYADDPDVYFNLLECLCANRHLFAEHTHMIFWFSMTFYRPTVEILEKEGGWRVDPFPLIWDKSPAGVLPDRNRGFRRVYETALFCSQGDPKLLQPTAALARAGTAKLNHPSAKSEPVLEKFLTPLVDETTRMLDPTCGSGNAIKIAQRLKAGYALGIELDPEFYMRAKLNVNA